MSKMEKLIERKKNLNCQNIEMQNYKNFETDE